MRAMIVVMVMITIMILITMDDLANKGLRTCPKIWSVILSEAKHLCHCYEETLRYAQGDNKFSDRH